MLRNLFISINLLYVFCCAGSSSTLIRTLGQAEHTFPGAIIYQLHHKEPEINKINSSMQNRLAPGDKFILKHGGNLYLLEYDREFNLFSDTGSKVHLHPTIKSNTDKAKHYLDTHFAQCQAMVTEIMKDLIVDEPPQVAREPEVQVHLHQPSPVNWDEVRRMFQHEPFLLFLRINPENCVDSLEMIGQKSNELYTYSSKVEIDDLPNQEDGFYIVSLSDAFYVLEKEGAAFYLCHNDLEKKDLQMGNLNEFKNYGFSDDVLEWFNNNIRYQFEDLSEDEQVEQVDKYGRDVSEVIFGPDYQIYSFVADDLRKITAGIICKQKVIQKYSNNARYHLIVRYDGSIFIVEIHDGRQNLVRFINDIQYEQCNIDSLDESRAIKLSDSYKDAGLEPNLLQTIHAQVGAFENLKRITNVKCVHLSSPELLM